ncbi:Bro-N domain-containing protein [Nitrosomonas sp. Nm34]|uniref:BRO-N domain-containing protein n=1 Tax=Nitrosomonas sp. Nm34 TaxID=1881055 RepID=UPI001C31AEFB|nr:Bro-N domain-containing protein [Nitrosomonas sp. Nm34]
MTTASLQAYPFAQVLKTPLSADDPAPESRGFFTSIDFLWSGVRLIKDLSLQGIRQPSDSGFEPPAAHSKSVKLKINYQEAIMAAHSNGVLAPVVFSFQSVDVRTFVDNHGEPWFCVKDICKILGYANDSQAIKDHCREAGVSKRYLRSGNHY